MSESKLTADVAAELRSLGFRVWTVNQTRRQPRQQTDPGVSDIIAFGHGATVFIETKVEGNKQSQEQKDFQSAVVNNGSMYWLVYSVDDLLLRMRVNGWIR